MYIKQLTNEEFIQFKNTFYYNSFYQTPEYGFIMNSEQYDSLLLGLMDNDNNILAASLILIEKVKGFKYAYAPRGFLIDYNDLILLDLFTTKIKKYLEKMNVVAVKISPRIIKTTYDPVYNITTDNQYYEKIFNNLKSLGYKHLGYNDYFEASKPRFEAVIDLNVPSYMLFRNIKKEYRTKIRSAEKKGVKIHRGNINDLEELYKYTKSKYKRNLKYFKSCYEFFGKKKLVDFYYSKLNTKQYLEHIKKSYEDIETKLDEINEQMIYCVKNNLNTDSLLKQKMQLDILYTNYKTELKKATKMLTEYPQGIVTSSALIIKNEGEIYILIDGFDMTYKNTNSKHLLIWKLMEKYSREGYHKFNLGGMTNYKLKENKYNGLNKFKFGFGSKCVEYIGDLELITNSNLYVMFLKHAISKFLRF